MPCDLPRAGLRGNRRLAAGAAGFGKTRESAFHKAAFPFCDDRPVDADQLSRVLLIMPSGAGGDDARPPDFPLGSLGSSKHGLRLPELGGSKRKNASRAGHAFILIARCFVYLFIVRHNSSYSVNRFTARAPRSRGPALISPALPLPTASVLRPDPVPPMGAAAARNNAVPCSHQNPCGRST